MHVSRLMFALLVSVAILGTVGCKQSDTQPGGVPQGVTQGSLHGYKNLKCEKDVTVTLDPKKHGADKEAIYVCEDEPDVTWIKGPNVNTFRIDFDGGICPFTSCQITDTTATGHISGPLSQQPLTVYPYKVTINGNPATSDPQVVGGGSH
jgi:hypothetical protein